MDPGTRLTSDCRYLLILFGYHAEIERFPRLGFLDYSTGVVGGLASLWVDPVIGGKKVAREPVHEHRPDETHRVAVQGGEVAVYSFGEGSEVLLCPHGGPGLPCDYVRDGHSIMTERGYRVVAKEYIAAQDPDDPGVLVLSRFAGAAEQLTEALIVNPYDVQEVADTVQQALQMPLRERRRRWATMMRAVTLEDVTAWRQSFVSALMAGGHGQ